MINCKFSYNLALAATSFKLSFESRPGLESGGNMLLHISRLCYSLESGTT